MSAPREIVELVRRFDANSAAYSRDPYNEAQLRREFVDPFFESLGWDMTNRQGYAEAYKDVIHKAEPTATRPCSSARSRRRTGRSMTWCMNSMG